MQVLSCKSQVVETLISRFTYFTYNLQPTTYNSTKMKIIIRLPNWLGDVVMSTAFISAVKQLYPDALVDVIIKQELSSIASLIPGLNAVHPFAKPNHNGLSGVYRFGKKLKSEKYDLFFNLPSSLSSLVLAWATGAKKKIGFATEGGFFMLNKAFKKYPHTHRVDGYTSLLEHFTGKIIVDKRVKLYVDDSGLQKKNVVINFNSEAVSRRMPLDKGIRIINVLTQSFADTTFTFIGSLKESSFVEQVINGTENKERLENQAGRTDLIDLSNLLASSAVLLSTDSGPAHLANSLGTPVVVLFGAGNENQTAPYNKQNLTVLRSGKLSCEPCQRNTCELYGIPECMRLIDELRIIDALKLYLPHA